MMCPCSTPLVVPSKVNNTLPGPYGWSLADKSEFIFHL